MITKEIYFHNRFSLIDMTLIDGMNVVDDESVDQLIENKEIINICTCDKYNVFLSLEEEKMKIYMITTKDGNKYLHKSNRDY
jgi:hypothetical protein